MALKSETAERKLLLVDDDKCFLQIMARSLTRRGFDVMTANSVDATRRLIGPNIQFAVVDLLIGKETGLTLLPKLRSANPDMRIVLLTGYASILTAVEAIKLGANNYLPKPASMDDLLEKLLDDKPLKKLLHAQESQPFEHMEWNYLQKALLECDGNVSATARMLRMHRRTLQRKLANPPAGVLA